MSCKRQHKHHHLLMTDDNSLFVPRVFYRNRPPTPNPLGEELGLDSIFSFKEHELQQQQQQQKQQQSPYSDSNGIMTNKGKSKAKGAGRSNEASTSGLQLSSTSTPVATRGNPFSSLGNNDDSLDSSTMYQSLPMTPQAKVLDFAESMREHDEKDKREMLEQLAKSLGCSHMLKNDSVSDRVDSVDFSEPKASAS